MALGRGMVLVLAAVFLVTACTNGGIGRELPQSGGIDITLVTPGPTPSPTPTPMPTATPVPTPTPILENACLFNPDPATAEELQVLEPPGAIPGPAPEGGEGEIEGAPLEEPQEVLEVRSPLHVRGWSSDIARDDRGVTIALVDEQVEFVPIVDAEGQEVETVDAPPLPPEGQIPPPGLMVAEFTAPFAVDIGFRVEEPQPVCLWVFIQLVGSSEAQQVVQVPLRLLP